MIDLSSNINFLRPDVQFQANSIDFSFANDEQKLYKTLAHTYNVYSDECELFNGSNAAIYSFIKYLKLCTNIQEAVLYAPIYPEYKKILEELDFKLTIINRYDEVLTDIPAHAVVFFSNPATPDGTYYELEALFKLWHEKDATVFIDESFIDYTTLDSAQTKIHDYDKLFVLKCLSRFYATEGIKLATLIASRQNIEQLKRYEAPSRFSHFDTIYIEKMLKDRSFKAISQAVNLKNMMLLKEVLLESKLFDQLFDSKSNFILARLKQHNYLWLQERLDPYKISVKECSKYDFLNEQYVRVTATSKQELVKLREALQNISF